MQGALILARIVLIRVQGWVASGPVLRVLASKMTRQQGPLAWAALESLHVQKLVHLRISMMLQITSLLIGLGASSARFNPQHEGEPSCGASLVHQDQGQRR